MLSKWLSSLLGNFSKDIGIDLGTANTLVYIKGKGVVIDEPSVVAIDRNTKKVLAVGMEAKNMLGRTPSNIVAVRPLKDGVIADFDTTQQMLKYFIRKVVGGRSFIQPRIVVGVPSGITDVEKRAVIDATIQAGAREAFLLEEPMAAAIGSDLPVYDATGSMVVDIGGGTTDVAVISLGGISARTSVRVGGDKIDEAIVQFVKKVYHVLISDTIAEELKIKIGAAIVVDNEKIAEYSFIGRDLVTGLPKNVTIDTKIIVEAIAEPVTAIVEAVTSTLEKTSPMLASDIMNRGIMLTGGGALLRNIDKLLSQKTGVPVFVAEDALACVAYGTGKATEKIEFWKKAVPTRTRKKTLKM